MRVILDTDPGNGFPGSDIDDGLALGLILASPELRLEAMTIVGGNTPVEWGRQSGLAMLGLAGADIPLYVGSSRPMLEDAAAWRRDLDGRGRIEPAVALWKDISLPSPRGSARPERAADAIVDMVDGSPGEFTIIAIGPLTNIAEAMLLDPDLPRKVERIVIMGGAFGVWCHPQELNFCYDPEAAKIVVTSGAAVTLVPLDVTLKTYLTLAQNDRLKQASGSLARFLGETGDPWIRWIASRTGRSGCALHDPLAVATLLDPTLVKTDKVCVDVELAGRLTRGRPVSWLADDDVRGSLSLHQYDPIDVVVDVDNDAFVALLLDRLSR